MSCSLTSADLERGRCQRLQAIPVRSKQRTLRRLEPRCHASRFTVQHSALLSSVTEAGEVPDNHLYVITLYRPIVIVFMHIISTVLYFYRYSQFVLLPYDIYSP